MTSENPQDGRLLLYHLALAITVTKTDRCWEMDFGYYFVRRGAMGPPPCDVRYRLITCAMRIQFMKNGTCR